jgi:hypothetical protein
MNNPAFPHGLDRRVPIPALLAPGKKRREKLLLGL